MDDAVWDATVFTKNRERLIEGAVSQQLLESVLVEARAHELLSMAAYNLMRMRRLIPIEALAS